MLQDSVSSASCNMGDNLHPIIVSKNVKNEREAFIHGEPTTQEEKTEVMRCPKLLYFSVLRNININCVQYSILLYYRVEFFPI